MTPALELPPSTWHCTMESDTALHPHLSNHISMSQKPGRRSPSSSMHRTSSTSRVVKPSSTNTSPRRSLGQTRRRTMAIDAYVPTQTQLDTSQAYPVASMPECLPFYARDPRPTSWHPGCQPYQAQPLLQVAFSTYANPPPNVFMEQAGPHYMAHSSFSPGLTARSSNTSPESTFSPLPLESGFAESGHFTPGLDWQAAEASFLQQPFKACDFGHSLPTSPRPLDITPLANATDAYGETCYPFYSSLQAFDSRTPPTPESFPQVAEVKSTEVAEQPVPYQVLEDDAEGEILVGMGLYDAPEKCVEDVSLNNYRSTITSLLASDFRSEEHRGRGLKLEETWEPPNVDDKDDDNYGEGSENGDVDSSPEE